MITDDRFRWQEASKPAEMVELYLLETMSFGGILQSFFHKEWIGNQAQLS
jgi:hypothetical protein